VKKKDRIKLRKLVQVIQKPIIQKPVPKWVDNIGFGCVIFIILISLSFGCGIINDSSLKQSCYKCNHRFDNFKDFSLMSKEEAGKMTNDEISKNFEEWRRLITEQTECERTHTFVSIRG
jgi:hypothetical protein